MYRIVQAESGKSVLHQFSQFTLFVVIATTTTLSATAQEFVAFPIDDYILPVAQDQPTAPATIVTDNQFQPPIQVAPSARAQALAQAQAKPSIPFASASDDGPPVVNPEIGHVDRVFAAVAEPAFEYETGTSIDVAIPSLVATANQSAAGQGLLGPALARATQYSGVEELFSVAGNGIPSNFQPWWNRLANDKIGSNRTQVQVSLDSLIQSALRNSPNIQVAATEPRIQQANVFEESARFDWQSFLETKYDDVNDPIGNTLTTGDNSTRFRQQEWFGRGGLRRTTNSGGEVEVAQRFGFLDNNSRFLIPPNQGSSRLELNYRHPLFRGGGRTVNESLIVLADIDYRAASDDFLSQLQTHLTEVTETYWELVRSRSEYRQREKLLRSADIVLANLEGRAGVDALDRQIFRARAAVARRRAEIARSITSIRNAESRLRLLVNDPEMLSNPNAEFVPVDTHRQEPVEIELSDVVSTALLHRPDISQAIRDVSSANVRLGVSKNELLPKLDFLVGSYVAGLDGDSDVFNSWINQFRDGRPGFNVGFDFELPIGNRAARARQQRRQWEVNRSLQQFRAVVESGITEVEIAAREVQTAQQEISGQYRAMVAAASETDYLVDRWQTLPEADDSVTLLLENLLDSQERQADAEAAFARAQFDFAVAMVRLKQAMGTLFQVHDE